MKKSIISGILLSFVVISFSGCDNSINTATSKTNNSLVTQSNESYKKNIHFSILEKPLSFPKNHVMEYFWYGCPHCFAADKVIKEWAKNKNIELNIRHSVLYPNWMDDAAVFYTFKEMKVPSSVSDKYFSLRQMFSVSKREALSSALKSNNISEKEFERIRSSDEVSTAIQINKIVEGTLHTKGTPSFVVSGKYLVNISSLKSWDEVTSIADYLIKNQPK